MLWASAPVTVSVTHSTGPISPARNRQGTYGRTVCARQAFAPAGHAGLSDALRTVETASTVGGHRPPSLIPGAHQVPARAMRGIIEEVGGVLVDFGYTFFCASRINGLAEGYVKTIHVFGAGGGFDPSPARGAPVRAHADLP